VFGLLFALLERVLRLIERLSEERIGSLLCFKLLLQLRLAKIRKRQRYWNFT
jgi:hypothetical protein